jgi:type VII secretion-associated protein (TIGR03931 family)
MSRCEVLQRRFPGALIVEIAPHLVLTLHEGRPVGAESRSAAPGLVAEAVTRRVAGSSSVWVDGPAGVPGAAELAAMITAALHTAGTPARIADGRQLRRTTTELANPGDDKPGERRWRTAAAAAAVAVGLGGIAATALWGPGAPRPEPPTTALVEGRVTTRIPVDWVVRHVTVGPGSARVEVASPHHAGALLHVTQARVPTDDLAATAAALRTALDAQPPGVFVDFNPSDRRAGRMAVTYREVRSGHDITWTVVVDGGMRIGIGCQAPPGRRGDIDAVCDEAVRTARAIA